MARTKRSTKNPATTARKSGPSAAELGVSVIQLTVIVAVVGVAAMWLTIPKFDAWCLFCYDHILGRFGFQNEKMYHCKLNRFDAETDFSKLVHSPVDPSKVIPPPTINASEYSPELVRRMTDNFRLPIRIKGLFKESVAGKKWTPEYIRDTYGDQKIIYHDLEFPIVGPTSTFQREHQWTMGEFVDDILQGGHKVLGNDHYLMKDYPELIEELELDRWVEFDSMPIKPLSLRFFMGGNWTGVGWHAATSHNLFVEVYGKKLFKWLPPSTSASRLNPTLSNKLPAVEHCEGHFYDPDLVTMEAVLEPGDAIYTPAWVWHATRHLEPTVAVGLRMESFLHDVKTAPQWAFLSEFSSDIPGVPFFNGLVRGIIHSIGLRIQGQPLSRQEKEHGYPLEWLKDYMQAGGKLKSEEQKDTQWKL
mmetsp:Transcript_27009/g.75481  ORF Transcript_27009/g.75481 Transcript_27009/m.75481 type:complete len:418 (+) Transcript_27009:169-1422(+)